MCDELCDNKPLRLNQEELHGAQHMDVLVISEILQIVTFSSMWPTHRKIRYYERQNFLILFLCNIFLISACFCHF